MKLKVVFKEAENMFKVGFNEDANSFKMKFEGFQRGGASDAETYDGVYEITPTTEPQTLPTARKIMAADVIVNAIPKEYGLVTYNQDKIIKIT